MKNRELEGKIKALAQMAGKKLPIKLSLAISKNIESIGKELEAFEKARIAMLTTYSEKDADGKPIMEDAGKRYKLTPENLAIVQAEYESLGNDDADLTVKTVPVSVLEACEDERFDALTVGEINALQFMIVDD